MPPLKWLPDTHDGEKAGAITVIDLSAEAVNHAVSLKLQLHPYFCDNFSAKKTATLDGQTPFALDYWTELRLKEKTRNCFCHYNIYFSSVS